MQSLCRVKKIVMTCNVLPLHFAPSQASSSQNLNVVCSIVKLISWNPVNLSHLYLYSSPSSNPPKSSASKRAEPGELRPSASSMDFSCCCPPEKIENSKFLFLKESFLSPGPYCLTLWGNSLKWKYLTRLELNLVQDCWELNLRVGWDWWEMGEWWVRGR